MSDGKVNSDTTTERPTEMTPQHPSSLRSLSRRSLLRSASLVTVSGGLLAACADPIDERATRIGDAPKSTALPTVEVTDVVLLRTAMSMEYLVHDIIGGDAVAAAFTKSPSPASLFVPEHLRNVAALAALVSERNGEPYDKANPKLMSVFGTQAVELVAVSDQRETDAHALSLALETLLAATYQNFVSSTQEPALRAAMMRLGARASRNATVAAQMIRGGVAAFAPGTDENGAALVATLPTAFGSLTNVQVSLGAPNETGARTQITMDTPSLNSYIY